MTNINWDNPTSGDVERVVKSLRNPSIRDVPRDGIARMLEALQANSAKETT